MPETSKPKVVHERDSVRNTLSVAVILSLVCSVLVASTAVLLKPKQQENAERYRQAIILDVAGLYEPGADVAELFAGVETRIVNLADGRYADSIDDSSLAGDLSVVIPEEHDLAQLRRRPSHARVYLLRKNGAIDQVVLPVYGAGLWSTMYGYLAVAGDGTTVRGLRFYEHGETPGLGDRIDDADWRAQWVGKHLYDDRGQPRIEVARSAVQAGDREHQVDGLSGATLTGRGVTNLVRYWVGPHGFGPYLQRIQDEFDGTT